MLKVNGFVAGESVEARAIMKRGSSATPPGRGALSSSPSAVRRGVVPLTSRPRTSCTPWSVKTGETSPPPQNCLRPGSHGVTRQ